MRARARLSTLCCSVMLLLVSEAEPRQAPARGQGCNGGACSARSEFDHLMYRPRHASVPLLAHPAQDDTASVPRRPLLLPVNSFDFCLSIYVCLIYKVW